MWIVSLSPYKFPLYATFPFFLIFTMSRSFSQFSVSSLKSLPSFSQGFCELNLPYSVSYSCFKSRGLCSTQKVLPRLRFFHCRWWGGKYSHAENFPWVFAFRSYYLKLMCSPRAGKHCSPSYWRFNPVQQEGEKASRSEREM